MFHLLKITGYIDDVNTMVILNKISDIRRKMEQIDIRNIIVEIDSPGGARYYATAIGEDLAELAEKYGIKVIGVCMRNADSAAVSYILPYCSKGYRWALSGCRLLWHSMRYILNKENLTGVKTLYKNLYLETEESEIWKEMDIQLEHFSKNREKFPKIKHLDIVKEAIRKVKFLRGLKSMAREKYDLFLRHVPIEKKNEIEEKLESYGSEGIDLTSYQALELRIIDKVIA